MHELPVIRKIVRIAAEQAERHSAVKVLSLTLETGALSDLEPEWLNHYFKKASAGTILADTELKVVRLEASLKCRSCSYTAAFKPGGKPVPENCPECGKSSLELKADSHYTLKEMEVL